MPPEPSGAQAVQAALLRVLKSLVFREEPGIEFGEIPLSQLRCLHIIAEHEGQKMNEVSHRMEVKLPAASQIVDRLVKRGMVERHADAADRRVVRLDLTAEARETMRRLKENRDSRMLATLQRLSADDIAQVVAGLDLLGAAAEGVVESESGRPALPGDGETVTDLSTLPRQASRVKAANTATSV